jgi:hypothetical protein
MVMFKGKKKREKKIIGGIRGIRKRRLEIERKVDDFQVGGFMILCGISLDEYNANRDNLSRARIDYSAMATYGRGKRFRTEISPNFMGDYSYRVTNIGRIGMELRKDSPDGDKVGFLSALASNMPLFADSSDGFALYPVYVFFNKRTQEVTTLRPQSQFETVTVSPRPANENVQSYIFPADEGATWDNIVGTLTSPVAYVTVTNNVPNQSGRVTIAGTQRLNAQNGYDTIGGGETLTFEVTSTAAGSGQNLVLVFYNGALMVPVRFDGDTGNPVIKNGYDYTVSVSGSGSDVSNYVVTIVESDGPRDLSDDIMSL